MNSAVTGCFTHELNSPEIVAVTDYAVLQSVAFHRLQRVRFYIIFLTYIERVRIMPSISEQIMEYAEALPEGAVICPDALSYLGKRPAIYQSLSRLVRRDKLMRIYKGLYVRTIETRFGNRPPDFNKVIESLSELWGETIVPSGGGAANFLGLTEQVPMRMGYLTSGPDRRLWFDALRIDLRHAPPWQLVAPNRPAGTLVRALTFVGRREVKEALDKVVPKLSEADFAELLAVRRHLPVWITKPLNAFASHDR